MADIDFFNNIVRDAGRFLDVATAASAALPGTVSEADVILDRTGANASLIVCRVRSIVALSDLRPSIGDGMLRDAPDGGEPEVAVVPIAMTGEHRMTLESRSRPD